MENGSRSLPFSELAIDPSCEESRLIATEGEVSRAALYTLLPISHRFHNHSTARLPED